jgi:hypothetical protein
VVMHANDLYTTRLCLSITWWRRGEILKPTGRVLGLHIYPSRCISHTEKGKRKKRENCDSEDTYRYKSSKNTNWLGRARATPIGERPLVMVEVLAKDNEPGRQLGDALGQKNGIWGCVVKDSALGTVAAEPREQLARIGGFGDEKVREGRIVTCRSLSKF